MKTLHIILSIPFLLITFYTHSDAQSNKIDATILDGSIVERDKVHHVLETLGQDADGYYIAKFSNQPTLALSVATKDGPVLIEYFDRNLGSMWETDIGLENPKPGRHKHSVYEFGMTDGEGNIHVFFSEFFNGTNRLYRAKFNKETKDLVKETLVFEESIKSEKIDRRGTYLMVNSSDNKLFGIFSSIYLKKEDHSIAYLAVFTRQNLDKRWEKNLKVKERVCDKFSTGLISTKNENQDLIHKALNLSNSGEISIAQILPNKRNCLDRNACLIFSFNDEIETWKSHQLENNDFNLVYAILQTNHQDQLFLASYLHDKEQGIEGLGIFTFQISSLEVKSKTISLFDHEQRKNFLLEYDAADSEFSTGDGLILTRAKNGEKLKIPHKNMPIKMHLHKDNSITIMGEEAYIYQPQNGAESFVHSDLHFIKLNPDHEIEWVRNKNHSNGSVHPDLSKTGSFIVDDKINFVYYKHSDKEMVLSSIDSSGTFSYLSLAEVYKKQRVNINRFDFNGASYYLFDNKELIFSTHRREEYKMAKITFNQN